MSIFKNIFKEKAPDMSHAVDYPFEKLMTMLREEDILELVIKNGGGVLEIGAASDCDANNVFFDKAYYIAKQEYKDPAAFESALYQLTGDTVTVVSIDSIPADKY